MTVFGWMLVDKDRKPVPVGSEVTDFRGDKSILAGGYPPRHEGSTGRIMLEKGRGEYYPSVCGLQWVKITEAERFINIISEEK